MRDQDIQALRREAQSDPDAVPAYEAALLRKGEDATQVMLDAGFILYVAAQRLDAFADEIMAIPPENPFTGEGIWEQFRVAYPLSEQFPQAPRSLDLDIEGFDMKIGRLLVRITTSSTGNCRWGALDIRTGAYSRVRSGGFSAGKHTDGNIEMHSTRRVPRWVLRCLGVDAPRPGHPAGCFNRKGPAMHVERGSWRGAPRQHRDRTARRMAEMAVGAPGRIYRRDSRNPGGYVQGQVASINEVEQTVTFLRGDTGETVRINPSYILLTSQD